MHVCMDCYEEGCNVIPEQIVTCKWSSSNKKHYISLGHPITKIGEEFKVDVKHLTKGSRVVVNFYCDYCDEEKTNLKQQQYKVLLEERNHTGKDSCGKKECKTRKTITQLWI